MASEKTNWTGFAIKFAIVAAAVIAWSVWDRSQRRADLAAIQANTGGQAESLEQVEPASPEIEESAPQHPPLEVTSPQVSSHSRETESVPDKENGNDHQQPEPPQANDLGFGPQDGNFPTLPPGGVSPEEFQNMMSTVNQAAALFGEDSTNPPTTGTPQNQLPLFASSFGDVCAANHEKQPIQLSGSDYATIRDAVECLDRTRAIYVPKKTNARQRDYLTFVSPPGTDLTQLVSSNLDTLSDNARALWRFYVKSYEKERTDFARATFVAGKFEQYSDLFTVEEYKRAITIAEISPGQLLAIEGELRLMLFELESIWLNDVAVNRVAAELTDKGLNMLPDSVLRSILRPEELKAKSAMPTLTLTEKLGMGDDEFSIEDEFEPNDVTRQEFRDKFQWLSKGPDSAKLLATIKKVESIRKPLAEFQWPDELTKSIFEGGQRPVYNNPYE